MATVVTRKRKNRLIRIRCTDKTFERWQEVLFRYKKINLTAEDLILDALELLDVHGYPRKGSIY